MEVIRSIRNLRAEKKVTPGQRTPAIIVAGEKAGIFREQAAALATLAGIEPGKLEILENLAEKPTGYSALVISGVEAYLPLAELVDLEIERARLEKELSDTQSQITRLENLLNSPFAQRAPEAVVEKERQKLAAFMETAEKLKSQITALA
jgi:valyl-tRNA synthetase